MNKKKKTKNERTQTENPRGKNSHEPKQAETREITDVLFQLYLSIFHDSNLLRGIINQNGSLPCAVLTKRRGKQSS